MNSRVTDLTGAERSIQQMIDGMSSLKKDGGGPTDTSMEARVARLEARFDAVDSRLDGLDRRLDRIENKLLTKWDVAQVVFLVVGALMAAAIFGPRLTSLLAI